MPDYEVTYPDGRKFKVSTKKPLSQKDAEEAIAKHQAAERAQRPEGELYRTEGSKYWRRDVGGATEILTDWGPKGGPGPKNTPPRLATEFGEDEPSTLDRNIARLRQEIIDDRAAPKKDLLDYAMQESGEARQRIKKMPLGIPKILADIGISTRDLALSPLSIPRSLGSRMDEAYDTTEGDQLAKTLAGLGAGAGGALDMATDFLPLAREGKQVARGEQPNILAALGDSFQESPIGTTLDLSGVAGSAAAGVRKVSNALGKYTTPQVSVDVRGRVRPATNPLRYESMGGVGRGVHNRPLFHHEPVEPGVRPTSGMARGAARQVVDQEQLQRTYQIMDEELLERYKDNPDKAIDALSRTRNSFTEILDAVKNDSAFVADAFRSFDEAMAHGRRPKFSENPIADLMLGRLYQDKLDFEIQELERSLESLPTDSTAAIQNRAKLQRKLDTILWVESTMLRPEISAAGRTLAFNRWYLRDPGSFASVNQKFVNLTGESLPKDARDRFYRYTERIRKAQQRVDERLETQALNAEPRTKQLIIAIKPLLERQTYLEAGIAKLESHKAVLEAKIRGEAAKVLEMGDGGAETISVEDAIRVINNPTNRRGMALIDPVTGLAIKAANEAQKIAENRRLGKAVKSADKQIAAKKKEHLDLRGQIKAKLAEAEKSLTDPPADLSPPLPPVSSTKGMTRAEIQERARNRKEAAQRVQDEKVVRTTAERDEAARVKQEGVLDSLGATRATKKGGTPAVQPKVSPEVVTRSKEIAQLDMRVRRGRKSFASHIDEPTLDKLAEDVATVYRVEGYKAAVDLWTSATDDARQAIFAERKAIKDAERAGGVAAAKAERERIRAEKTAKSDEAKALLDEIKSDYSALKAGDDVLAKHAAIPGKQAERAAKAAAKSMETSQGILDRLGYKPEAKPKNPLVNELALLRAQEVRSLDSLANRLREKYGAELSEDFIKQAFADAVKTYEEVIGAPLLPGEKGGSAYSLLKAKLELEEAFNTEIRKRRGMGQKLVDGLAMFNDSMRSVMASMDLSYLGRQAGLAIVGRPSLALGKRGPEGYAGGFRTGATAGLKSFQRGGTEKSLSYIHDIESKILTSANNRYGNERFYQEVGLDFNIPEPNFDHGWVSLLMDPKTQIFGQEEFRGGWAKRIPGLKQSIGASDRAFAAGVNVIRQEMFDAMYNPKTMDLKGGTSDAEAIARMVNVTTGRGYFNNQKANQAMPALAYVLFSPKYTSSRIEMLGKHAMSFGGINPWYDSFASKTGAFSPARKAIRAEQRKITKGLMTVYAAAWFAGLEVGQDGNSSTFGMIKLPSGAWLDPLAGEKQILVPILRGLMGVSQNLAGKERETDLKEQTGRYTSGRLAPGLSMVFSTNLLTRKPEDWKDYNDSPLVKDDTKTRWKTWVASDGVQPGSGAHELAMWLAGAEALWMKSGLPLTATQMLEEFSYQAKQNKVSPETAAWVLFHTALNASGISTMNYDTNRGAQNRRRGSSNPMSIPDPMRSLERQLSVPGM